MVTTSGLKTSLEATPYTLIATITSSSSFICTTTLCSHKVRHEQEVAGPPLFCDSYFLFALTQCVSFTLGAPPFRNVAPLSVRSVLACDPVPTSFHILTFGLFCMTRLVIAYGQTRDSERTYMDHRLFACCLVYEFISVLVHYTLLRYLYELTAGAPCPAPPAVDWSYAHVTWDHRQTFL